MGRYGATLLPGGGGNGPYVGIEKAENGYMVTLQPAQPDPIGILPPMLGGGYTEQGDYEKMREEASKQQPRVFVFLEIEQAWSAIKEFLLDGRMPSSHKI